MKTEQFDDAIKRKVESIDHRFEEKEVDKVMHFVRAHHPQGWLRSPFRRFMTFSFAGLVLTGIITWKLTSIHDHEILNQTVAEIKKNLDNTNSGSSNLNHNIIADNTTATNKTTRNPDSEKDKTMFNEKSRSLNNDNGFTNNHIRKEKNNGTPGNTKSGRHKINMGEPLARDENSNSGESNHSKNKKALQPGPDNITGTNKESEDLVTDHKTEYNNQGSDTISGNILKQKDLAKNNQEVENKIPDTSGKGNTYRAPRNDKHPTHPANWHVMTGITAGFGNNRQLSGGFTAELMLNRKFSVNTGFRWLFLGNESAYTEQEMNEKCGKDFYEYYLNGRHDNDEIINIKTEATIIQIPVAFSYYIPLKKDFAISFSVGTDLDLYKYQMIRYDDVKTGAPLYGDNAITKQLPANGPGVLFNNFVGSVGVLKQWNHFVIQINPYFSQQLIRTDYKLEPSLVGINLKLMGSLGKGGF